MTSRDSCTHRIGIVGDTRHFQLRGSKQVAGTIFIVYFKTTEVSILPTTSEIPALMGLASVEMIHIYQCGAVEVLPDLSSLLKLQQRKLWYCEQLQEIPALSGLESLNIPEISGCKALVMPTLANCEWPENIPGLSGLALLKVLVLSLCPEVERVKTGWLPGLMDLSSLEVLDASWWEAMKEPDLSMLQKLRELVLSGCRRLVGIPGLGACCLWRDSRTHKIGIIGNP
ncbi:hypothetical protein CRG98_030379 [Punica granatum]|uniref:Uncharacterized protein n=1 Tax=Punica granatum TaxID=22663 RepID=A0A2I0IZX1_PUNGR|nr:hypothetical protein CRG98_030379 [Punica granatum]